MVAQFLHFSDTFVAGVGPQISHTTASTSEWWTASEPASPSRRHDELIQHVSGGATYAV